MMSCGESICVQFLTVAVFPHSKYACSNFQAGQGAVTYGWNRRMRADLLLSMDADLRSSSSSSSRDKKNVWAPGGCCGCGGGSGIMNNEVVGEEKYIRYLSDVPDPVHPLLLGEAAASSAAAEILLDEGEREYRSSTKTVLRFWNYDGLFYHGDGKHMPDCPLRPADNDAAAAAAAASTAAETRRRRVAGELLRDRFTSVATVADDDDEKEEDGRRRKRGFGSRMRVYERLEAMHELAEQATPQTMEGEFSAEATADREADLLANDYFGYERVKEFIETKDQWEERLKVEYAAALTSVDPDRLEVRFDIVRECDLLHRGRPPSPGRWNELWSQEEEDYCSRHKSVADLLSSPRYSHDVVLGTNLVKIRQSKLVALILRSGYNFEGSEMGGFVCLTSGKETRRDLLPGSFGFCMQRAKIDPASLGDFTKFQAKITAHRLGEQYLDKLCSNEQTLSATSFHPTDGETLSLDFFRFLCLERGLQGFTIRHLILYTHKKYLAPFINGLLQRRHDLKRLPPALRSPSKEDVSKLMVNGVYGFTAVEKSNFAKTRVLSESYLKSRGSKSERGLYDGSVFQVTLLGCMERGEKKDFKPELLYAATSHRPQEKICNVLQVAGTILGRSKVLFLSKILMLLRYFDERKLEICYCDTDSCLIGTSSANFRDLVKDQYADNYDQIMAQLMEDTDSPLEQSGKFKLEYSPFRNGLFRCCKCYYLQQPTDLTVADVMRMKSIPRKHVDQLSERHFGQDPERNTATIRGHDMRATSGMEVIILTQGKTISHSLNTKRCQLDPCHTVSIA